MVSWTGLHPSPCLPTTPAQRGTSVEHGLKRRRDATCWRFRLPGAPASGEPVCATGTSNSCRWTIRSCPPCGWKRSRACWSRIGPTIGRWSGPRAASSRSCAPAAPTWLLSAVLNWASCWIPAASQCPESFLADPRTSSLSAPSRDRLCMRWTLRRTMKRAPAHGRNGHAPGSRR